MDENSGIYQVVETKEEETDGKEIILVSTDENPTSNFIEQITVTRLG